MAATTAHTPPLHSKPTPTSAPTALGQSLCLFLAGAGLGWLVGMSVSPVIQGIVTAITGLIVMLAGSLSRVPTDHASAPYLPTIRPYFAAALVGGIVLGTVLGVWTRTKSWLEPTKEQTIKEWTDLGLEKREVARALLSYYYPTESPAKPESKPGGGKKAAGARLGALFAGEVTSDEKQQVCDELRFIKDPTTSEKDRRFHERKLMELLTTCSDDQINQWAAKNADNASLLRSLAEVICAK